jgi:hypothetical protein
MDATSPDAALQLHLQRGKVLLVQQIFHSCGRAGHTRAADLPKLRNSSVTC